MKKCFNTCLLPTLALFAFVPSANAFDMGNLSVDLRLINIAPNDSSSEVRAAGAAVAGPV